MLFKNLSYNLKKILPFKFIIGILFFVSPPSAFAYIGPGAGFAVATSLFLTIATLFLAILGILLWPIKKLYKKIKTRKLKKISSYCFTKKKVVILGFDGMDYSLLSNFIKEGKLPTLSRLSKTGTFTKLISTNPPESPVAWSSFMTGCNPGKHNIFDFLARDPQNYLPQLSLAEVKPPKFTLPVGKYKVPLVPGPIIGKRKGIPFWELLGERDINTAVLRVPVTFPPGKYNGAILSSMGVPDLLGSQGTFTFYTTDESKTGKGEGGGGVIIKVDKNGKTVETHLPGPKNSLLKTQPQTTNPMKIEVNETAGIAIVRLPQQGESFDLHVGKYSPWVEVVFPMGLGIKANGICKFYLKSVAPEFELYVTPINIHPEKPSMPVSHPGFYSRYLSLASGRFSTLGLAEDTWALNKECISEEAFLQQCYGYLDEREKVFFHELDKLNRGCLVQVFDSTDRIQHMFWQYIDKEHPKFNPEKAAKYKDEILKIYDRMDKITEQVLSKTDEDTTLYILSDHGFKTFRYGMNVNTWLKKEGYLTLKNDAEDDAKFFRNVDWTKTKAYSIGLSGIYLNVAKRERHGIVPENKADALISEISGKLLEFKHPGKEISPLHSVKNKKECYTGEYLDGAPDMVLGFRPGYRVSWHTALGGTPADAIIEENHTHWSGDHCLDPELVPGIFLSSKKLSGDLSRGVSIMDIAPTILKEFEIDPPEIMDGKSLI